MTHFTLSGKLIIMDEFTQPHLPLSITQQCSERGELRISVKVSVLKPKMASRRLANWSASFCAVTIIQAIFAAVLVTHATALKNANNGCLTEAIATSPVGSSCTLKRSLVIATAVLFVYSLGLVFHSVFWLIHACCERTG